MKRLKVIQLQEQKDIGDPEKVRRRLRDFLFDRRIDRLARAAHGKAFSEVSTVANGDEIARLEHDALIKRVDEERVRLRVEKLFSRRAAASGTGLVAVWCRFFDSVICSKGDEYGHRQNG